jgi:hypothetical protein
MPEKVPVKVPGGFPARVAGYALRDGHDLTAARAPAGGCIRRPASGQPEPPAQPAASRFCRFMTNLTKGRAVLKRRIRWLTIPVALMSVAALAVMSVPASAASGIQIKNEDSGKCLSTGGNAANPITQYSCGKTPNQEWTNPPGQPNALENVATGKCITNGGSHAQSAKLTQYDCNGSKNQQWPIGSVYSNTLVNGASGKCMTNGGSHAQSAPITQYTCSNSLNQKWD